MLGLFTHLVPVLSHIMLWEAHVIGLPQDTIMHSGPYLDVTISAAGPHFLVKDDMVKFQLAVVAVYT